MDVLEHWRALKQEAVHTESGVLEAEKKERIREDIAKRSPEIVRTLADIIYGVFDYYHSNRTWIGRLAFSVQKPEYVYRAIEKILAVPAFSGGDLGAITRVLEPLSVAGTGEMQLNVVHLDVPVVKPDDYTTLFSAPIISKARQIISWLEGISQFRTYIKQMQKSFERFLDYSHGFNPSISAEDLLFFHLLPSLAGRGITPDNCEEIPDIVIFAYRPSNPDHNLRCDYLDRWCTGNATAVGYNGDETFKTKLSVSRRKYCDMDRIKVPCCTIGITNHSELTLDQMFAIVETQARYNLRVGSRSLGSMVGLRPQSIEVGGQVCRWDGLIDGRASYEAEVARLAGSVGAAESDSVRFYGVLVAPLNPALPAQDKPVTQLHYYYDGEKVHSLVRGNFIIGWETERPIVEYIGGFERFFRDDLRKAI